MNASQLRPTTYPPTGRRGRRTSLADEVADYLRHLILTGELRPGERIDQEAVSDALGVSRSPIREAVVVLGQEGLVTLNQNRGASVAEITPDDIADHYELFGAVSGRAALAAELLTGDEIERTSIHRRFESGEPATMSVANHDFHRIINHRAPRRTGWLLALLERSVPADYYEFSAGLYADAVVDDAAILAAIADRDVEGARRAMEHHLRRGGGAATEALRRRGFWRDGEAR